MDTSILGSWLHPLVGAGFGVRIVVAGFGAFIHFVSACRSRLQLHADRGLPSHLGRLLAPRVQDGLDFAGPHCLHVDHRFLKFRLPSPDRLPCVASSE